jgi:hypothetical protein
MIIKGVRELVMRWKIFFIGGKKYNKKKSEKTRQNRRRRSRISEKNKKQKKCFIKILRKD